MLSAKEIYNAAMHNLQLVHWVRVGESEWAFVGESKHFKPDVLLSSLLNEVSPGAMYIVVNRHESFSCSAQEAVLLTKERLSSGDVVMCDLKFCRFLQVARNGVFRYGALLANHSLQARRP